jgi:hypothetical protein
MTAYAFVAKDGTIDVATVSPTERAAMVNTIYTATYGNMVIWCRPMRQPTSKYGICLLMPLAAQVQLDLY